MDKFKPQGSCHKQSTNFPEVTSLSPPHFLAVRGSFAKTGMIQFLCVKSDLCILVMETKVLESLTVYRCAYLCHSVFVHILYFCRGSVDEFTIYTSIYVPTFIYFWATNSKFAMDIQSKKQTLVTHLRINFMFLGCLVEIYSFI